MDKEKQKFQMQDRGFKELAAAIREIHKLELVGAEKVIIQGKPGDAGKTPEKGVDYLTPEEKAAFIEEIKGEVLKPQPPVKVEKPSKEELIELIKPLIPKPKKGEDAEPVDYLWIEEFILSKIPPKDDPIDTDEIISTVLAKIPPPQKVTINYEILKKFCLQEIQKIENNRESRVRSLHSGGPTTRLSEISDVDTEDIEIGQVLVWNGTGWEPGAGGGGSSTNFVDNELVSNSTTTTFTLADIPVAGSVHVYGRGQRLTPAVDYTILGSVITTFDQWTEGEILADYRK